MKLSFELGGKSVSVELRSAGSRLVASIDGRPCEVEAAWTSARDLSLLLDGRSFDLQVIPVGPGRLDVAVQGHVIAVGQSAGEAGAGVAPRHHPTGARLVAPMPGKIVAVLAQAGDRVEAGQSVVVIEAMKMENELLAPASGLVKVVAVGAGQVVESGSLLLEIG